MTHADLDSLINEVLRDTLGPSGFARADIRNGVDHDGDQALFITAHFRPEADIAISRPSLKALGDLRVRLLERDEERFPYLDFAFPGDELLAGDDPTGPN